MKKYWTIFRVEVANIAAFKGPTLIWLLFDLLWIAVFPFIWLAIMHASGEGIAGWNQASIVQYYVFMALLNNLIFMHPEVHVSNEIYQGKLTNYLVRPQNYLFQVFLHEGAWKIMRTLLFIPIFGVIVLFSQRFFEFSLGGNVMYVILASLFGIPIFFLSATIIAFTSFWLEDSLITRTIFWITSGLFGGQYAPLAFMPDILQKISHYFPFRYAIYFPLEIISRPMSNFAISMGFIGQGIWIFILILITRVVWKYGLRRYSAIGR
jgi:ABC-2 type transport system permease protein